MSKHVLGDKHAANQPEAEVDLLTGYIDRNSYHVLTDLQRSPVKGGRNGT